MMVAACVDNLQNENDQLDESGAMITETITARVNEGDTKATIDGSTGTFAWTQSDDKIAVHTTDGYFTSEGASASGASASFTVSYTGSRNAFAIYPSNLVAADAENYGQEDHTLDVTLPAIYTLEEVSGETSPCPMIAANTPGVGWEFKQLCGLLRITIDGIPDGTTKLDVYFGRNVAGQFSIPSPVAADGSSAIAVSNASGNNAMAISITGITTSEVTVNLPLPVGEYGDIIVTATQVNGSTYTLKEAVTTEGSSFSTFSLSRKDGKLRSLKMTELTSIRHLVSSVAKGKYVIISKGNLQAKTTDLGNTWTWQFAETPWEYIGEGGANKKINGDGRVSVNGTVDLFGWVGASNTTWSGTLGTPGNAAMHGISDSKTLDNTDTYGNVSNETLKSDWGNTINDGYAWRTPTITEWLFLLNSRSSGSIVNGITSARYTLAQINTEGSTKVCGLIIFPDGVTIDNSEASSWSYINNGVESDFGDYKWSKATQCTAAQWSALAAKGCVFLPSAGIRNGWEVYYSNDACYYWSSSPDRVNYALFLHITNHYGALDTGTYHERWYGHPVRLIRNINF